MPLQVRNQVVRFMPEAHRRQAAIDLTTENATSAAQVFALGDRDCVPWPPEVAGAHGDTTTSRVGSSKGWPLKKGGCVQSRTRNVLAALDPHGPVRSGGERRNMRRYGTPSRKNAPSLPRRLQATLGPGLPLVGPCSGFRRGPLPYRSRVGDWMLIFVGSFSALISAGMPDLFWGKS